VIATQSSWFLTTLFVRMRFVELEISNPSVLCRAASPPLAEFASSPAELSRVRPEIVKSDASVMSKQ